MADECVRLAYKTYDLHAAERQINHYRRVLDALKLEREERRALRDWTARKPTSRCGRRWRHKLAVEDARWDFDLTLRGGMSCERFARLHPHAVAQQIHDSLVLSKWGQRWVLRPAEWRGICEVRTG